MKIKQITETTTAGAIATVNSPLGGTQSRGNPSIYGGKKVGSLFKGKKTSAPYANSINESAELSEAQLEEDDVIVVPGQGRKSKTGFVPHGQSRVDHEVEMARSDLFQAAKNAQQVYSMIKDVSEDEGLDGWVQEKIIKANDYLNTVREYLEGKQTQGVNEGPEFGSKYAEKLAQYVYNVRPALNSEDEVLNIGYKVAVQDLASQTRAVSLFSRDQDFPSDFVSAYRFLQKRRGVTENNQRGDSLVTDALKIMRGAEVSDAVRALTTVLGNREYNSRRGFYNFYIKQMIDMYRQQGLTEGVKSAINVSEALQAMKQLANTTNRHISTKTYNGLRDWGDGNLAEIVVNAIKACTTLSNYYKNNNQLDYAQLINKLQSELIAFKNGDAFVTIKQLSQGTLSKINFQQGMAEGKRNLKCVCKTHGTMQCPVHTPKDIEVIENNKNKKA
jgi:hypothetical protein